MSQMRISLPTLWFLVTLCKIKQAPPTHHPTLPAKVQWVGLVPIQGTFGVLCIHSQHDEMCVPFPPGLY